MYMGFIDRVISEYKYITQKRWTYDEAGRHWDSVTDYDEINNKTYSYFRRFTDGFQLCTIPGRSYVLDICSRTGKGTVYFHEKGKIGRAVCANVAERLQDVCRASLKKHGIDAKTVTFKALPLPFPDEEFDAALCFETIEHMPNPKEFMEELARVTKKGGELLLTTPNILWGPGHWFAAILNAHHSEGPCRFLSRRAVLRSARKAGFALEREKATIVVPFGPKALNRFNDLFECILPERILRLIALRRIFVFRRKSIERPQYHHGSTEEDPAAIRPVIEK
jgi:ubiquinone/menaquinone biosynthesis C-methylase UbiE